GIKCTRFPPRAGARADYRNAGPGAVAQPVGLPAGAGLFSRRMGLATMERIAVKLRRRLRKLIRLSAKSALALGVLTTAARADKLLLLVGAPGEPAYAEGFAATVATWQENAAKARMAVSLIDGTGEASARERLQQWIAENATDF